MYMSLGHQVPQGRTGIQKVTTERKNLVIAYCFGHPSGEDESPGQICPNFKMVLCPASVELVYKYSTHETTVQSQYYLGNKA